MTVPLDKACMSVGQNRVETGTIICFCGYKDSEVSTVVAFPFAPPRCEYLFSNVKIFRKIHLFNQNTSKLNNNRFEMAKIFSDFFRTGSE
jgi:hypothetical protein